MAEEKTMTNPAIRLVEVESSPWRVFFFEADEMVFEELQAIE